MATWTAATSASGAGVVRIITAGGFGSDPQIDMVEVYIPRSLAPGGKLFGRLQVTPAP